MNIKRLQAILAQYPDDVDICAFDADALDWLPITGLLYHPGDDPPSVYLQTDSDQEVE